MEHSEFEQLEEILGYTFQDKALLRRALTHKTFAFEANTPLEYNERLEFLGDSVLNFVVAEELYKSNRYFSEGELTRRRANEVNNKLLAEKAKKMGIGTFILFGRGEVKQNGAQNRTNLANTLEAIIGAIYLDSGLDYVRTFVLEKLFTKEFQF